MSKHKEKRKDKPMSKVEENADIALYSSISYFLSTLLYGASLALIFGIGSSWGAALSLVIMVDILISAIVSFSCRGMYKHLSNTEKMALFILPSPFIPWIILRAVKRMDAIEEAHMMDYEPGEYTAQEEEEGMVFSFDDEELELDPYDARIVLEIFQNARNKR